MIINKIMYITNNKVDNNHQYYIHHKAHQLEQVQKYKINIKILLSNKLKNN
jgi:hypothetical protein